MAGLRPSEHEGRIVWLGRVLHRDTLEIAAEPLEEMPLSFAGFDGEFHAGLSRPSCSRVRDLYPRGTTIRNTRQLSVVSAEEVSGMADELGLETIDPAWLGASVVVEGFPDFTNLPPSSRLQTDDGTTLTIDVANGPCNAPAKTIEAAEPGHGKRFRAAAAGRRGVTAWVEREGALRVGQRLRLFVPDQRAWQG